MTVILHTTQNRTANQEPQCGQEVIYRKYLGLYPFSVTSTLDSAGLKGCNNARGHSVIFTVNSCREMPQRLRFKANCLSVCY